MYIGTGSAESVRMPSVARTLSSGDSGDSGVGREWHVENAMSFQAIGLAKTTCHSRRPPARASRLAKSNRPAEVTQFRHSTLENLVSDGMRPDQLSKLVQYNGRIPDLFKSTC